MAASGRKISITTVGEYIEELKRNFLLFEACHSICNQVALSVLDEAVLARELALLRALRDNYPKTLLTLDCVGSGDHDGIEQVNIID